MPNPLAYRRLIKNVHPNRGAQFAGASSQVLSLADNTDLSMGAGARLTVAAWALTDSFGSIQTFLSKGTNSTAGEYLLQINGNGQAHFQVTDGTSTFQAISLNQVFFNGNWVFTAGVYDGANVSVTVNNAAAVNTAFTTDIVDGTNTFRLGMRPAGAALTGRLDAVGIWKRALTRSELMTLYNSGVGMAYQDLPFAVRSGLVAWWDLDDVGGSGATWVDKVGVNHLVAGTGTAAPTSGAGKR